MVLFRSATKYPATHLALLRHDHAYNLVGNQLNAQHRTEQEQSNR